MIVHLLTCASMCPIGGLLPRSVLPKALTCNCLLVETPKGLVLIDTGIGLDDMTNPKRLGLMSHLMGLVPNPDNTAIRQVQRLGFSPSDVSDIILTHLDLDHAGGLPDFPNATIHVLELEQMMALSPSTFKQRGRYRACHWKHEPKWQTYEADAGEAWNGFRRVRELRGLPPELLLISLPGHTQGHAGVVISTGSGWVLHAGDAYYDRRQVGDRATVTPGMALFQRIIHEDFLLAVQTRNQLRDLALRDSAIQIICTHDVNERIHQ